MLSSAYKQVFTVTVIGFLTACGGSDNPPVSRSSSIQPISSSIASSSSSVISSIESSSSSVEASSSSEIASSSSLTVSSSSVMVSSSSSLAPINQLPTANAGTNQVISEGEVVALAGIANDPDGSILAFLWEQTGGPTVSLSAQANSGNASFTAIDVNTSTELTFKLTVTDNDNAQHSDSITVTILPVIENGSVTVSWNSPNERENGSALAPEQLDSFHIKYTNTSTNITLTKIVDGTETSAQIENMPAGAYIFQVATKDTDGLMSDYSSDVSITLN